MGRGGENRGSQRQAYWRWRWARGVDKWHMNLPYIDAHPGDKAGGWDGSNARAWAIDTVALTNGTLAAG
jgi:hypothetical protein